MRSELEIWTVLRELGIQWKGKGNDVWPRFDVEAADTFQYGFLMGKLTALGWVIGSNPSGDMSSHYDYEDFVLEQRSRLGGSSPPTLQRVGE